MPRLRRSAALLLAVTLLTGLAVPGSAFAAGDCPPQWEFECGGGGGGGGNPSQPTTTQVSAPAAAPYNSIEVSASVQQGPTTGYIAITLNGETRSVNAPSGTVTFSGSEGIIGSVAPVQAVYSGDGYSWNSSTATTNNVYFYGSKTISGSFTLNGQSVAGAAVSLLDQAGGVAASTTTGIAGSYTLSVDPVTAADAQKVYTVRVTSGGVSYYYSGGTSASTLGGATFGGPTQWRPSTAWNISGISAPVWPTVLTRTPAVGVPYSTFLGATSNVAVTYLITSGTLPAGLTLNSSTGEISGTATAFGNRNVIFQASNGSAVASSVIPFRVDGITSVSLNVPAAVPYVTSAVATVASAAGFPPGIVSIGALTQPLVNGSATFSTINLTTSRIGTNYVFNTVYTPTGGTAWVGTSSNQSVYVYGSQSVSGTFIQNGVAVEGVEISLVSTTSGVVDSATTDASGRYTLSVAAPTTEAEARATYYIRAWTVDHFVGYYSSSSTATSATVTDLGSATFAGPTEWRPGVSTQNFYMKTNPVFQDVTLATPRVGSVYADGVSASDPSLILYGINSGALPAGLSLNPSTGAITGTPTSTAAATFTIRAYSSPYQYGSASRTFTLTPLRAGIIPTFTDEALDPVVTGIAVDDEVTATGDPTIVYSIHSGNLPSGVQLNTTTGAITGTTSSDDAFSVTIRATNEFGFDETTITGTPLRSTTAVLTAPATAPFDDISVSARVSSTYGTPQGQVSVSAFGSTAANPLSFGLRYFTLAASSDVVVGTTANFALEYAGDSSYNVSSATASTYLYGTDTVTGVLTENGEPVSGATVRVMDGSTEVASDVTDADGRYTITVDASTVALATSLYRISATTDGGLVTWFAADSLATDETPTSAEATASGPTQWRTDADVNLHISTAPTWTETDLATPRQGTEYSDEVAAETTGGTLEYEVSYGTLPDGLELDSETGAITGTPTDQLEATFTLRAFTEYGSVTETFTITPLRPGIVPEFASAAVGDFDVAVPFEGSVSATGDPTIEYSLSGIVPAGITIDSGTGAITGTPLYNGPYSFTVRAENDYGFDELVFAGWVDAVAVVDIELGFAPGTAIGDATITLAADGLQAGSEYSLTMFSTPRVLTLGAVDTFRSVYQTISLPADTPVGAHRLELRAVGSDGTPLLTTVYFTLLENGRIGAVSYDGPLTFTPAATGRLAHTGTEPWLPLGTATLLLLVGLVLVRRRQLEQS